MIISLRFNYYGRISEVLMSVSWNKLSKPSMYNAAEANTVSELYTIFQASLIRRLRVCE